MAEMDGYADCYRCGEPGHWIHSCPDLQPAISEEEHLGRIRRYVDRWVDGKLTLEQKRAFIAAENHLWYGEKIPRHLTYP